MRLRVAGMVWIQKKEMDPLLVAHLRSELTIIPRKATGYDDVKSEPIRCYIETPFEFGVPRAFWFGSSTKSYDYDWDVSFGSKWEDTPECFLKHEGHYAEQGEIIDLFHERFKKCSPECPEDEEPSDRRAGLLMGGIFQADTGFGKCLGIGTPVLMYDGEVRPVEDILAGERVMGPDSRPRVVTSTTTGTGRLFKIVPTKGDPWVCNDVHVLTLVNTRTGNVVDIPLDEYLRRGSRFKHEHKLFQPDHVDFEGSWRLPVDPYFVGLWIGDGTKDLCAMRSLFVDGLRIPKSYLTASREERLRLLAGLLDSDGSLATKGSTFEFVQKNRSISDGVAFLARSLGFKVTARDKFVNGNRYDRLLISGDTSIIPVLIGRKRAAPRRQKKNPLRTGFKVVELGEGKYAGFTLDGDGRFLLGDFTVTHNTDTALGLINRLETTTLVIVHKEFLQNQWVNRAKKWFPDMKIGIVREGRCDFEGKHVVVAMAQSLALDDGGRYPSELYDWPGLLVVDECFIGSQRIQMMGGRSKPISEVGVDDVVVNVNGGGLVKEIHKREVPLSHMVVVKWSDGESICTDSHPFLTQRGWVSAAELCGSDCLLTPSCCIDMMIGHGHKVESEYMRLVREGEVGAEGAPVLFQGVCREGEAGGDASVRGVQGASKRGQRDGSDEAAGDPFGCVESRGVGSRVRGGNRGEAREGVVADPLQNRPGETGQDGRNRGGWPLLQHLGEEGSGQEEGCLSAFKRVVSVSRAKRDDIERHQGSLGIRRTSQGDLVTVYNLSVSGHPSYSLADSSGEGIVVHNCHRVGAPTWAPIPPKFSAAWRLGLTATPRRRDGADKVFWWHIGEIVYKARTETPKPNVRMIKARSDNLPPVVMRDTVKAPLVINVLVKLKRRNRKAVDEMIKALKAPAGRKLFVLSERLDHLRKLEVSLQAKWKEEREAGSVPDEELTTGFYVGEWFTGEVVPKLAPRSWPMKDGGRERAIEIIFRSLVRRWSPVHELGDIKPVSAVCRETGERTHHVLMKWGHLASIQGIITDEDEDKEWVHVCLEDLEDSHLYDLAKSEGIAQTRIEKKKRLTEEELREAERARVIFATYQMCCVDIDIEIVDPLSGEVTTMRKCLDEDVMPRVVSGRHRCGIVDPAGVGLRGEKRCVEVVVGGIGKRSLVLTPDHMVWTQRGWVKAGDLIVHDGEPSSFIGDYVATPRKIFIEEQPTTIEEDEAWLLGLLLTDGSLSCPQRGSFELTSDDEGVVEEAQKVLVKHGMYLKKERHQRWVTRTNAGKAGRGMKSWLRCELERLGMCKAAHDKVVPLEIMAAPVSIMSSFFAGYMDGDGCVDLNGRVSFSSVSRKMLEQFRTILLRLGIPSMPPHHGGKECWVVSLGRHESLDVRRLIPMRLTRKRDRVGAYDERRLSVGDFTMVPPQMTKAVLESARRRGFLIKDIALNLGVRQNRLSTGRPLARSLHDAICRFVEESVLDESVAWLPVRAVVDAGRRMVGDFSVPPDKSWSANGIIVHNSEGVDIPALDTEILVSPVGDVEQANGRIRRICKPEPGKCNHFCPWRASTCEGKPQIVVVDIVDLGIPLASKRERYRRDYYATLGTVVAG